MIKVLHVITGLEMGGAEALLANLVARMDRQNFSNRVVSLTGRGTILGDQIEASGVPVHALGFRRGLPDPRLVPALKRQIRNFQPDMIQTWLYHADFAGALAAGSVPLIWGIHNAKFDRKGSNPMTMAVASLNRRLAFLPKAIVCCGAVTRDVHAAWGFPAAKLRVIDNGVDTDEFAPDLAARQSLRCELNLPISTPLVGLLARWDPKKDHANFFAAARILHEKRPDVHFVLTGGEIDAQNPALTALISDAQVESVTHLLGLRPRLAPVAAALDVATCSSAFAEAFGLMLAEPMACGVPPVTTDLPGPAAVVAGTGRIVPTRNPAALAAAWEDVLTLTPAARACEGARARQRIIDEFSLGKMVRGYENLYEEMSGK